MFTVTTLSTILNQDNKHMKHNTLRRYIQLLLLLVLCSLLAHSGIYDDRRWSTRFGLPGVLARDTAGSIYPVDSLVIQSLASDSRYVYLGGSFTNLGPNIVSYERSTQQFQKMGLGLDSSVRAICIYRGDCVAGGLFKYSGPFPCPHIARFDTHSNQWETLGQGINGNVIAMVIYRDELIVAGNFQVGGQKACRNIARWNGSEWQSLGNGVANGFSGEISSMCVYRDKLLIAGKFTSVGADLNTTSIAAWDGSSWSNFEVSSGLNLKQSKVNRVHGISAHDSLLAICGRFDSVGLNSTVQYAPGLILYDSHVWSVPFSSITATKSALRQCIVSEREVFVCGDSLTQIDNIISAALARYDRSTSRWHGAGSGLSDFARNPMVRTLYLDDDLLFVGGRFTQAGGFYSLNVACFHTQTNEWTRLNSQNALGFNGPCIVNRAESELLAAGLFTHSGESAMASLARWDGHQWRVVGSGIPGGFTGRVHQNVSPPWPSPQINCVTKYKDEYYIGGDFTDCGGVSSEGLIIFDGTSLRSPRGGVYNAATWGRENVSCFRESSGKLLVGGAFVQVDNVTANNIAAWDGVSWSKVAPGIDSLAFYDPVSCIHRTSSGRLFVGGAFYDIGNIHTRSLVELSGSSWVAFPGEVDNRTYRISCMDGDEDDLYVAGYFSYIGGIQATSVAHWNGSVWTHLSGGLTGGQVEALKRVGDEVYITGNFKGVGDSAVNYVAVWNIKEQLWHPLGTGLDAPARSIAVRGDTVFFGGDFLHAGPNVSAYVAAWLPERSVSVENSTTTDQCEFQCYPNPVSTHCKLLRSSAYSPEAQVRIVDAFGLTVLSSPWSEGENALTLSTTSLRNGRYMFIVSDGRLSQTKSFIVLR